MSTCRRGRDMDLIREQWQRFIAGEPTAGQPGLAILNSWRRSREAGVEPEPARLTARSVDVGELSRRLEANAELIDLARPHLDWLSATLQRLSYSAHLTDRDGVVLTASNRFEAGSVLGREPGEDWSETSAGTNEIALTLAADQFMTVQGPEYFVEPLHSCAGAAAPVHAPDGSIAGTVGLSLSVTDANPERFALIAHIARIVGRELTYREQIRRASHDTAARKHAEDSLKRSESHLRLIADHAPTLTAHCDRQCRYKYVNRG